jgi:hypothetical protein
MGSKEMIMSSFPNRKIFYVLVPIFLLAAVVVLLHRSSRMSIPEKTGPVVFPETFTFFDLGSNTRITEGVRKSFREILGPEAISKNTTVELEICSKGFLLRHFGALDELNRRLNTPAGDRIEHQTLQLSYRYPVPEYRMFQNVSLLFSQYNQLPLLVDIASKSGGKILLENLKKKYGNPLVVDTPDLPGKVYYWKRHNDYALVSETPDRYGEPTYRIKIYFTENIRELIKAESKTGRRGTDPEQRPF